MIDTTNINTLWTSLLIEELTRLGVSHICLSPGSRSAPLTVAAARNKHVTTTVYFDERGAAFFALGHARATGLPTALICTSGTAVANYLPAVVEAYHDEIPLILLTADRPSELQGCGANQTIRQIGIFGSFVRREIDLPCPDDHPDLRALLLSVRDAVAVALSAPRGPVHINCPFREPLAPTPSGADFSSVLSRFDDWVNSPTPLTSAKPHSAATDTHSLETLCEQLRNRQRGIVVVGTLASDTQRDAVLRLVTSLGWPALPDVTSGLRTADDEPIISHYDLLLSSDRSAPRRTVCIQAPPAVYRAFCACKLCPSERLSHEARPCSSRHRAHRSRYCSRL
jgi:2-succinyl-5-enolpyruvyl-6-hydroxy-3-cyclohexene-1-carboxylate synthase